MGCQLNLHSLASVTLNPFFPLVGDTQGDLFQTLLWSSDRPSRGYLLAHGLRNCKRNLIVLVTLFHIDGAIAKVHDQHAYIEEMSS